MVVNFEAWWILSHPELRMKQWEFKTNNLSAPGKKKNKKPINWGLNEVDIRAIFLLNSKITYKQIKPSIFFAINKSVFMFFNPKDHVENSPKITSPGRGQRHPIYHQGTQ